MRFRPFGLDLRAEETELGDTTLGVPSTTMKSPGLKFRIERSMKPAIAFPSSVVDESATAAVTRIPRRLINWPRGASSIGSSRIRMMTKIETIRPTMS